MRTDSLIIGCGIAGAVTALELAADRERDVVLLTRAGTEDDSNSVHAQGGIVYSGKDDSPELLEIDIAQAGDGISNPEALRILAAEGPQQIRRILMEMTGVEFDRDGSGELSFGLEGAHSRRRVLHVGDFTGRAIMAALLERLRSTPNVRMLTGHTAIDLLTFPHNAPSPLAVYEEPICHGAWVLVQENGTVIPVVANRTVLATGGLGQIFLNTTNPPGARGDGLAMAYRAGARVINAEYMQFHPTALFMSGTTKALISEAVRGEGAVLLSPDGEPFMERYAPEEKELAPRDVVSRAIYLEMLSRDYSYVLLDIASRKKASFIKERFPRIYDLCLEQNYDISRQPVPVVPAAHYHCGGVMVDMDGHTSLRQLLAGGEVACTGVHGANRLASTSLLEGVVWGARAAAAIRKEVGSGLPTVIVPDWDDSGQIYDADPALIQADMQTVRSLMWHHVGLIRSDHRLRRALKELWSLRSTIEDFYRTARLVDSLAGLRNSVLAAGLITMAAVHNTENRGCHYRENH
jgi:L-aspartate oxidase